MMRVLYVVHEKPENTLSSSYNTPLAESYLNDTHVSYRYAHQHQIYFPIYKSWKYPCEYIFVIPALFIPLNR